MGLLWAYAPGMQVRLLPGHRTFLRFRIYFAPGSWHDNEQARGLACLTLEVQDGLYPTTHVGVAS